MTIDSERGILEVDLSERAAGAADEADDMLGKFGLADEPLLPAPVDQRVLVLIELEGGNDGPSAVVPHSSGTSYDSRPTLAIPAEDVQPLDAGAGLNPAFSDLHQRQLVVVKGVDPVNGSLTHSDTPKGHKGRHERLMETLNGAIHEFLNLMDAAVQLDRVLVATTSWFAAASRRMPAGSITARPRRC